MRCYTISRTYRGITDAGRRRSPEQNIVFSAALPATGIEWATRPKARLMILLYLVRILALISGRYRCRAESPRARCGANAARVSYRLIIYRSRPHQGGTIDICVLASIFQAAILPLYRRHGTARHRLALEYARLKYNFRASNFIEGHSGRDFLPDGAIPQRECCLLESPLPAYARFFDY